MVSLIRGAESQPIFQSFQKALVISQAEGGLVAALPVAPDSDGLEILIQSGEQSTLDGIKQLLAMGTMQLLSLSKPGHEPSVWRVSPAHEFWVPLMSGDQRVGYLLLLFNAPRQWTIALRRALDVVADELGSYVALWRSRLEALLFRSVVDQSLDAIALLDGQERIVYANEAHVKLARRAGMKQVVGKRLDEIMPSIKDGISHSEGEADREEVVSGLTCDGGMRWLDSHFFPVTLPDGVQYKAVIHRDITAQRCLMQKVEASNQELRVVNEQLQQAQVTQRTFLAMVTHELKTPLHLMLGAMDTLARLYPGENPGRSDEFWAILKDSAHQLDALIDDLLTVTRLQTGALTITTDLVDVVKEVDQCVRCWSGCDARVVYHPPKNDIPIIMADSRRLRQILDNLVANALAFCQEAVHIELDRHLHDIVIRVWDDGPGIAPEIRDHIFEPFFRRRASGQKGMGLGLTVAQGLAHAHGGTLFLKESDQGALFELRLPFTQRVWPTGRKKLTLSSIRWKLTVKTEGTVK